MSSRRKWSPQRRKQRFMRTFIAIFVIFSSRQKPSQSNTDLARTTLKNSSVTELKLRADFVIKKRTNGKDQVRVTL